MSFDIEGMITGAPEDSIRKLGDCCKQLSILNFIASI
jgi:hypothetical protein